MANLKHPASQIDELKKKNCRVNNIKSHRDELYVYFTAIKYPVLIGVVSELMNNFKA